MAGLLSKHGYSLWQFQYGYSDPEGFHARFAKTGRQNVEVVTHNSEVQKAIVQYKREYQA
jgi:hypothetical protein